MSRPLLLDYRAVHGGQPCRLIIFEDGDAELRCGTAVRRAVVTWVERRLLDDALHRCEIASLPRFYNGGAPGGATFSLKYRGQDVRVAQCLTRDLWLRFPMLETLEELVTHLNGWPPPRRRGLVAPPDVEYERQARVERQRHRFA